MSSSLRCKICKNNKQTEAKAVVLSLKTENGWTDLSSAGKNKLRMAKVSRVFLKGGEELTWGGDALTTLPQDSTLVLSNGDAYSGVVKTAEPKNNAIVTVLCKASHLDDEAVKQLNTVCQKLEGVKHGVGLPDLHPGRGFPVGAAIASEGVIHPNLVGNDIGCGMLLVQTSISRDKAEKDAKKRKWAETLGSSDLDLSMGSEAMEVLEKDSPELCSDENAGLARRYCDSFGTVGGGNHFAELQVIDRVVDDPTGLVDPSAAYLMIHSGSRGIGSDILSSHLDSHGGKGIVESTEAAKEYIDKHDFAVSWASANRRAIASRFLETIGEDPNGVKKVADMCHNNVERQDFNRETLWLHRKGAAPATKGLVVIPGSRGAESYLVKPTEKAGVCCGFSLAHGAGRELDRSSAVSTSKGTKPEALRTTALDSYVVCNDVNLLYEEVPGAYKNIENVIEDLTSEGLITVVAVLRPVVTFKTANVKALEKRK